MAERITSPHVTDSYHGSSAQVAFLSCYFPPPHKHHLQSTGMISCSIKGSRSTAFNTQSNSVDQEHGSGWIPTSTKGLVGQSAAGSGRWRSFHPAVAAVGQRWPREMSGFFWLQITGQAHLTSIIRMTKPGSQDRHLDDGTGQTSFLLRSHCCILVLALQNVLYSCDLLFYLIKRRNYCSPDEVGKFAISVHKTTCTVNSSLIRGRAFSSKEQHKKMAPMDLRNIKEN